MKYFSVYKCGLLLIFVALATGSVFAQDLGSSNTLFDPASPQSKNTKTPSKKTVPKPKSSSAANTKKASSKPKTSSVVKTASSNSNESRKNAADKISKQELSKNVIITVGQPTPDKSEKAEKTEKANPVKSEFNELFEQAIAEGNAARDEREYTKAEAAYLRAQSLQLKDSRAIYGLGNSYSDQQRWEEAESAYRTAIEFEPNAPESYIALSFVLTPPTIGTDLTKQLCTASAVH